MRKDPSNNMTDLAGKTALITGSTSGIGKALSSATVAVNVGDALVNSLEQVLGDECWP